LSDGSGLPSTRAFRALALEYHFHLNSKRAGDVSIRVRRGPDFSRAHKEQEELCKMNAEVANKYAMDDVVFTWLQLAEFAIQQKSILEKIVDLSKDSHNQLRRGKTIREVKQSESKSNDAASVVKRSTVKMLIFLDSDDDMPEPPAKRKPSQVTESAVSSNSLMPVEEAAAP
jgi:hypothetical protein